MILQSNYVPWKGYFDLIGSADVFILYDIVQFTKNDWRNRNRIRTPQGATWLTIPVSTAGHFGQRIDEVEVSDARWPKKHWRAIETSYGRAPCFDEIAVTLRPLYERAAEEKLLTRINELFLRTLATMVGIATPIVRATDDLPPDRVDRLVTLCERHGARRYLTGHAAGSYLDESRFRNAGIEIDWMDYRGYPEYRQCWAPPFVHEVSLIDLLFAEGSASRQYMKSSRKP